MAHQEMEIKIKELEKKVKLLEQESKIGHCKECKYFEYDSMAKVDGIPLIVAHEICSRWGRGCKTKEDGYCFLFETQKSDDEECVILEKRASRNMKEIYEVINCDANAETKCKMISNILTAKPHYFKADRVPEEILIALLALINNIQLSMNQQSNGTPLDEIRSDIEEQLLETLSEGSDDWFVAKKV